MYQEWKNISCNQLIFKIAKDNFTEILQENRKLTMMWGMMEFHFHDFLAKISSNEKFSHTKKNPWNQRFSNLSITDTFTKFLPKKYKCEREFPCGKTRNSLSRKNISWNQLFSILSIKNVAFTKFLWEKVWERISLISTLWYSVYFI